MTFAVEATGLYKSFGSIQALNGVSLTIPQGGVFTILGPNGAGKSTLIGILTTMHPADAGTLSVLGMNPATQARQIRQRVGVVAQRNHFDTYCSIWDNLVLHARLHGFHKRDYEPRITELLHSVNLYDRRHDKIDMLSGGMQRKAALIRALIHEPKLLFLDEPTTGLDPDARQQIWAMVRALPADTTVILTTHYMEEAEQLSDTILLMHQGQAVRQASPEALKLAWATTNRYAWEWAEPIAEQEAQRMQATLATHIGPEKAAQAVRVVSPCLVEVELPNTACLPALFQEAAVGHLIRFEAIRPQLEDIFMDLAAGRIQAFAEAQS